MVLLYLVFIHLLTWNKSNQKFLSAILICQVTCIQGSDNLNFIFYTFINYELEERGLGRLFLLSINISERKIHSFESLCCFTIYQVKSDSKLSKKASDNKLSDFYQKKQSLERGR